jgi:hypothetical protein
MKIEPRGVEQHACVISTVNTYVRAAVLHHAVIIECDAQQAMIVTAENDAVKIKCLSVSSQ